MAVATALLIGISKAGFGSGPVVIATPPLALVMPVADAAALLLPILLLANLFAVRQYYNQVDKPSLWAQRPSFFHRQLGETIALRQAWLAGGGHSCRARAGRGFVADCVRPILKMSIITP